VRSRCRKSPAAAPNPTGRRKRGQLHSFLVEFGGHFKL
jgi:hypothetical protein